MHNSQRQRGGGRRRKDRDACRRDLQQDGGADDHGSAGGSDIQSVSRRRRRRDGRSRHDKGPNRSRLGHVERSVHLQAQGTLHAARLPFRHADAQA